MLKFLVITVLLAGTGFGRVQTSFNPALYFRLEKTDDSAAGFNLMGSELVISATLADDNRDIMSLVIQSYVWGTMQGWAKAMHYGNAYVVFPLGLGKPNIKLGQQVLPFGLLTEYDSHDKIFQPLFTRTLGLRIDAGASVFGILGPVDYWYMVSNGRGPNLMDGDNNKLQTGRIALRRPGDFADVKGGLSLLRGRLPQFSMDPLADMMAEPDSFVLKNRIGLDLEMSSPFFTLRAEATGGKNGSIESLDDLSRRGIGGFYAEMSVPLVYGTEAIGMYARYKPVLNGSHKYEAYGLGIRLVPPALTVLAVEIVGYRSMEHGAAQLHLAGQVGVRL